MTTNEAQGTETFTIPASRLPRLKDMVQKANRRLTRAGSPNVFTFTTISRLESDPNDEDTLYEVLDVTMNTPVISVNGYEFLATVTREGDEYIMRTAHDVELNGWRPENMHCEHCDYSRSRKQTYLVMTPEGKRMQVGSSCVRPLLGITPSGLWALKYDFEPTVNEREGGNRISADCRIRVDYLIALGLAVSEMGENFVSRSAVENGYEGMTTSGTVGEVLFSEARTEERLRFKNEARSMARRILAENRGIVDEIKAANITESPENDYQANLDVLMRVEAVTPRNMSLVVSSIASWNRQRRLAQEVADRVSNLADSFIADEDAKVQNITAKVTAVVDSYSTDYRGNDILVSRVNFQDEDNHEMVWWASRQVSEVSEGSTVLITSARVKKNTIYRGAHQSTLKNVRLKAV